MNVALDSGMKRGMIVQARARHGDGVGWRFFKILGYFLVSGLVVASVSVWAADSPPAKIFKGELWHTGSDGHDFSYRFWTDGSRYRLEPFREALETTLYDGQRILRVFKDGSPSKVVEEIPEKVVKLLRDNVWRPRVGAPLQSFRVTLDRREVVRREYDDQIIGERGSLMKMTLREYMMMEPFEIVLRRSCVIAGREVVFMALSLEAASPAEAEAYLRSDNVPERFEGLVGSTLCDMLLEDLQGRKVSVVGMTKDRSATVINIFATWCGPCNQEMPDLVAAYQEWSSRGVGFMSVDVGTAGVIPVQKTKAFLVKHGVTWPCLLDPRGRHMRWAKFYPTTLVVDRAGVITGWCEGAVNPEWLRSRLSALVPRGKKR